MKKRAWRDWRGPLFALNVPPFGLTKTERTESRDRNDLTHSQNDHDVVGVLPIYTLSRSP